MKPYTLGLLFYCLLVFGQCTKRNEQQESAATQATLIENGSKPITITLSLTDTGAPERTHLVLTMTNTSDENIPATGWKLFFNGGNVTSGDTSVAEVKLVNGDLRVISPGPRFHVVAPRQSATIDLVAGDIRNMTDFPAGFYLVFDKNRAQSFPVDVTINTGQHFAKSDKALAERIFDQNEKIKPIPGEKLTKVFPTPVSYRETSSSFLLDTKTTIVADKAFMTEASLLANGLATALTTTPAINAKATGKTISLRKNPALAREGYTLQISPSGIQLSAATSAGMFYGIQSLQTLLPPRALGQKADTISLPGLTVNDAPRFAYRAFMMDVARNFQPKSEVIKVLDVMGLYKLNVLHLHFSDDEGWRVEMPSLPELTAVGGTRAYSPDQKRSLTPSYGSGPLATNPAGTGFYSKADFVEILKYARERHIEVIPEIESPGHARAALRAMDARYETFMQAGNQAEAERYLLHDRADKSVYRSVQGWNDNVIDVSLPSTYAFMERVVDDLRGMYREAGAPLTTVHFGGDEVPQGVWQQSPAVQQLMAKTPTIKSTADLWDYYFGKVDKLLKKRGLYLSGWEEVGLKKENPSGQSVWMPNKAFVGKNVHVNVWKNNPGSDAEDLAYRMANAGYKVILTGVTHLYLDLAYNASSVEAGQYWGGYVDIDKPFYFIPYNYLRNLRDDNTGARVDLTSIKNRVGLTATGKANIVGIEAPLWSETNRTPGQFEYKLLPKLLAVAERAWAKDPDWATEPNDQRSEQLYDQAWSMFVNVVGQRELPRLDKFAGGFVYRIPTAGAKVIDGKLAANVQFPGLTIRYTTDGSEPTDASPVYTEPIALKDAIKLKVFNAAGRSGETITIVK